MTIPFPFRYAVVARQSQKPSSCFPSFRMKIIPSVDSCANATLATAMPLGRLFRCMIGRPLNAAVSIRFSISSVFQPMEVGTQGVWPVAITAISSTR